METEVVETGRVAAEEAESAATSESGDDGRASDVPVNVASLARPRPPSETPAWLNGIYAGLCLYFFLSAINVMGSGLKTLGNSSDWLENLLAQAHNPFIALMGAVLITAIVQSSSFTTSLIITLVATGQLALADAVFAVMGANIGTSVTNTIVAFANMRIRRQFQRAFTAAIVHDIFNWLTVVMLFPIEWITQELSSDKIGVLSRFSQWLAFNLGLEPIEKPNSPIKMLTKPVVAAVDWFGGLFTSVDAVQGTIVAIIGLLILFFSLVLMVRNLKGALLRRVENLFRRFFFRNDLVAYVVGVITTVLVQSSSVTTSLIVPLAGAGAVKIKRVFPYTLGANLGTTVTGVIAATANPVAAAVSVAIAHVTFNLVGTAIWYPLRAAPIGIAKWYAKLASQDRRYAFAFLFVAFLLLPGVGVLATKLLFG